MRVIAPLIGIALLSVNIGLTFFFRGGLLALTITFFVITVKNRKKTKVERL